MKTKAIILILFSLVFYSKAQVPYYCYTNIIQGPGPANDDNSVFATITDSQQNLIVCGYFKNTIDIDPGPAYIPYTSNGGYDIYLLKYDPNGNLFWAAQFGGSGNDFPGSNHSLSVDINDNVYMTGAFQNTVDFDPGAGVYQLFSNSSDHGFICKLNPNGNLVWAKSFDGAQNSAYSIDINTNSELFVGGTFFGTVDFDLNAGTNNLSASSSDGFICKYDTAGNNIWSKQFTGAGASGINYIDTDPTGNVFISGQYFNGSSDLNPGSGVYTVTQAGFVNKSFVVKLDNAGAFGWATLASGSTGNTLPPGIAVNTIGEVFISGGYETSIFSVSSGATAPNKNVYVAKLNPTTGATSWVKNIGGGGSDYVSQSFIATDQNNDIYIAGYFLGTIDINPDPGTFNLTQSTLGDLFCIKLNSLGNFTWGAQIGNNSGTEDLYALCASNGDAYLGGFFDSPTDFDPGIGNSNTSAAVNGDHSFICKLATCPIPQIVNDPYNTSNCEGDFAYFSITTNIPGAAYQWQVNTGSGFVNITPDVHYSNETTAMLTIANIPASMEGYLFRCVVSNPCGSDTSLAGSLDVILHPAITIQPQQVNTCDSSSATFIINATGDDVFYQWHENYTPFFGNSLYHGVGDDTLIIDTVTVAGFNNFTYYCMAFNLCSVVYSDTVTLLVSPTFHTNSSAVTCNGTPYTFGSQTLTAAGNYTEVFQTINGCDSVVNLSLSINPSYIQNTSATICSGSTYTLGTQTLTVTGNYTEVFQTINGCDSTINLTLTVNPVYNQTITATICNGSSYTLGSQTLNAAGNYTETFQSINGCDSIVNLSLTVSAPDVSVTTTGNNISVSIISINDSYQWIDCSNAFATISGETSSQYTATTNGNYAVIITNDLGCSDTSVCVSINGIGLSNTINSPLIKVYPIPAKQSITIEGLEEGNEIKIYDGLGKIIFETTATKNTENIDMTSLANGIYWLSINFGPKLITKKISLEK